MSSGPLQSRCQLSFLPSKLRCIGSQGELMVLAIGENVAGKYLTCSAGRHFDDWRGGPAIPLVTTVVVTFHKPASIPSAKAVAADNTRSPAAAGIATRRIMLSSRISAPLTVR